jgi:hypothetical protein
VKDLGALSKARAAFDDMQRSAAGSQALPGIGDRGFTQTDGSVIVIKDAKILTVDVTQLPAGLDKSNVATSIAVFVMGCWTGQ